MRRVFIAILVLFFAWGCQGSEEGASLPVFELVVNNSSAIKIHPELSFQKTNQSIGVLTAGQTSTYGFCPFRVGDSITVSWSETLGGDVRQLTLDTKPLVEEGHGIYTLKIVYLGGDDWSAQTLDKDGNLLKQLASE